MIDGKVMGFIMGCVAMMGVGFGLGVMATRAEYQQEVSVKKDPCQAPHTISEHDNHKGHEIRLISKELHLVSCSACGVVFRPEDAGFALDWKLFGERQY